MTLAEIESRIAVLEEEREAIETTLADIRGQIGKSSADYHAGNGGRDAAWYARAKAALRYHGADHQSVLRELGSLRRRLKDQRHAKLQAEDRATKPLSWYFYQIAKRDLPEEVFAGIFGKAMTAREEA